MLVPLMPKVRITAISQKDYDEMKEVERGIHLRLKSPYRGLVYYNPDDSSYFDKPPVQLELHPTELTFYEAFEGKEDTVDSEGELGEVIWKTGILGNVEVVVYKPHET